MPPIKILAVIFAVAVLAKLTLIIIAPHFWMKTISSILLDRKRVMAIYLILAAIVGYFVLTSLNIIDVAAVMLFTSLLGGLGLAPYSASLLKMGEEVVNVGLRKAWFPMAIWGLLALWILYAAVV